MADTESRQKGIVLDEREICATLFELWSIQNSILQSFRAMFIASETLIAAFAAFTVGEHHVEPERGLVLCLGIVLGFAWILICWSRGWDDSDCRNQIVKLESGQLEEQEKQVLTRFREFQNQWIWQKAQNLRAKVRPSLARVFLDLILPLIYIVCFLYFRLQT